MHAWTCIDRSSRPPNAPPTPPMRQPHLLVREAEALGDLVAVDVQPLGGDVEVDAALAVGDREAGLGAEEGLVLHPDLVLAGDDDLGGGVGVAVVDLQVAQDVAAQVQLRRAGVHRLLGGGDRVEHVVLDLDRLDGAAGGLGVVGGDDGDRLALVADGLPGEHGLVGDAPSRRPCGRGCRRGSARRGRRAWPAPWRCRCSRCPRAGAGCAAWRPTACPRRACRTSTRTRRGPSGRRRCAWWSCRSCRGAGCRAGSSAAPAGGDGRGAHAAAPVTIVSGRSAAASLTASMIFS